MTVRSTTSPIADSRSRLSFHTDTSVSTNVSRILVMGDAAYGVWRWRSSAESPRDPARPAEGSFIKKPVAAQEAS